MVLARFLLEDDWVIVLSLKKNDFEYGQSSVSYESGNRFKPVLMPERKNKRRKKIEKETVDGLSVFICNDACSAANIGAEYLAE